MSAAAVETVMSVFATGSLVAVVVVAALWLLACGLRLAERRAGHVLTEAPSVRADVQLTDASGLPKAPALKPDAFLFDRRLAAAAAGQALARRGARRSVVSADGQVAITLVSSSRREIEIALNAAVPPGTIAVVQVTDESGSRIIIIPLAADPGAADAARSSGVVLVPTRAQQVLIDTGIMLIQPADLERYSDADVDLSVGAAVGLTRRWWQELANAAAAGLARVPESTLAAVLTALSKH
jgi:hypothetical protein